MQKMSFKTRLKMETEKFINEQIRMIKLEFSLSQIQDNVYRFIFRKGIPNITINALIFSCMELYSEIIKRESNE